jgi:hypothetical protein
MRRLLIIVLLSLGSFAAGALKYLPASETGILVRRDLLPLDTDAITGLSDHLALLADGPFPKSASQVRHRAQVLTLSLQLHPTQARARETQEAYIKGKDRPAPEADQLAAGKAAILTYADWLTLLPPSSEGHLLGQLLLDIMQPVLRDHPLMARRTVPQAPKRWEGIIAPVTAFEYEDRPLNPKPNNPGDLDQKKYATVALLTEVPMMTSNEEATSAPAPGLIATSLVLTKSPYLESEDEDAPRERAEGRLLFRPPAEFNVSPLHNALHDFFETHLEPLPTHYNLNVNFGTPDNKRTYLSRNRENIAASLAMMLDSALTGRPLRRNTILFARLRASGKLEKPAEAWKLLLKLEQLEMPTKTRLIVGSGMIEEMTGLLVLDKASFFTRYEVLEAQTFEEARALYFQDSEMPEALKAASDGYIEVRDKADLANNLGNFLSLASVESRLVKASQFSPRHLSARMLATQAIRRPAYFSRHMAAQDLDRRLDPVSRFRFVIDKTREESMKEAYKKAREAIDPLERYLELREKKLLDEAVFILKKLNNAGRRASPDPEFRQDSWKRDVKNFQDVLSEFRSKLREIYQPAPVADE